MPHHPAKAKHFALCLALMFGLAQQAFADTAKPMAMDMSGSPDAAASTLGYQAAMSAMMADMTIPYSGKADVDFIRSMIPHHKGAVAMAKVVLAHGTDPDVRKLAEAVIATQQAEIDFMTAWLAKNGG